MPSYPKYRGAREAPVVVIGAGLTGCLTAYAIAAAGEDVVLLEAEQIGRGTTSAEIGWIAEEPAIQYRQLETLAGRRNARYAWQAWRRAALDFAALLRRLDVKCYLEPRGAVTIATTPEPVATLKKDQKVRADAGVDVSALNARAIKTELGIEALAGLRAKDGATLDPYRACIGIAAAAAERGAAIFEHTAVRRIRFNRKIADVFTAAGQIRTRRVVVATGVPTDLFRSLKRHFWFHSRYFVMTETVPARVRQQLGRRQAVVRDVHEPPHVVRWLDDERLIVAGADSEALPERQREKLMPQRTGQLMYELSLLYPDISGIQAAYGWAAGYARTEHGLPYIGAHRNFPHHVFAFGDSSPSVTGAYLASRILLRQCSGEMDRADEVFGFHR